MKRERIRLIVNMKDNAPQITWEPGMDVLRIQMTNSDIELALDLGPKEIRQLKQALSWGNDRERRVAA